MLTAFYNQESYGNWLIKYQKNAIEIKKNMKHEYIG